MKKLLIFSILTIPSLVQCKAIDPEDLTGIKETKAYAKNPYDKEGTPYSCEDLLNFPKRRYLDGSYFEPEDFIQHYVECAERYSRTAEAEILNIHENAPANMDAYKLTAALAFFSKNFEFSSTFRTAMAKQLATEIKHRMPPTAPPKEAAILIGAHDFLQIQSNCTILKHFLEKHGSAESIDETIFLCELKNCLAST